VSQPTITRTWSPRVYLHIRQRSLPTDRGRKTALLESDRRRPWEVGSTAVKKVQKAKDDLRHHGRVALVAAPHGRAAIFGPVVRWLRPGTRLFKMDAVNYHPKGVSPWWQFVESQRPATGTTVPGIRKLQDYAARAGVPDRDYSRRPMDRLSVLRLKGAGAATRGH
jgi:hypothetical protein